MIKGSLYGIIFCALICICNYKQAKILFVDRGLDSKLEHCGPCKISFNIWLHYMVGETCELSWCMNLFFEKSKT
jgi:hypothetical protein